MANPKPINEAEVRIQASSVRSALIRVRSHDKWIRRSWGAGGSFSSPSLITGSGLFYRSGWQIASSLGSLHRRAHRDSDGAYNGSGRPPFPSEFPLRFFDREVVDARLSPLHESV